MGFMELAGSLVLLAIACLIGCLVVAAVLALINARQERRRWQYCGRCDRLHCNCRSCSLDSEQVGV
jgi:hypothetical protein